MIIDLPKENDFIVSGLGFLNLAWEEAFKLYGLDGNFDPRYNQNELKDLAISIQRPLAISLALAQQGIEFLLKAKIYSVSPYLLLDGNAGAWAKKAANKPVSYADCRTIDSQDLIDVVKSTGIVDLPETFEQKVKQLRESRNAVFHTVDKRINATVKDIFIAVLEANHYLVREKSWIENRRNYLEKTPISATYSTDHVEATIVDEACVLLDVLNFSEAKRYFGVNKRQRFYICPDCNNELREDWYPETAQLKPNLPKSNRMYCFVCNKTFNVRRMKCANGDCKGNVMFEGQCMSCYG